MSDKDSSSNGSGSRDARMRGKRILAATLTLWLLPGVLGAVAMAQPAALPSLDGVLAPAPVGSWRVDALDWLSVRDTSGVPLSSYTLALDSGNNPLDLLRMGVILLLGVEFVGYMVIVTLAIGLLGYALSFRWLDLISGALTGVAAKVTHQIATPLLMAVAAAIGAVCVGWFVVRGLPAKATAQVVTMLGVAIVGVSYLADPLGDVLSSDGLLAHGRDLGISVAAGLNGQSHPDPGALTAAMQAVMADNFARKPVQVWNFGHVLDQWPSCRDAWSGSVRSGRDGAVLGAIKQCGDSDGYAKASTPGMGQLGTGLVLLLCAAVLLVFAVYLALKIVRTALNAVHHGLLAIFGFAAGGFVYGPTQTFLVRNLVDAVVAAGRMVAYTIFLGAYLLFLGGLFEQAQGQVVAVLVLGCAVMLAAVTQLRKLGSGLSRGNDWIADRVASAIQGQAGRSGAGGRALGMGQGGAAASLPGAALVALGALNTVNSNPLTGMVFRNNNPLNQFARGMKVKTRQDISIAQAGWNLEWQQMGGAMRNMWREQINRYVGDHDPASPIGTAQAVSAMKDLGADNKDVMGFLGILGFNPTDVNRALTLKASHAGQISTNSDDYRPLAGLKAMVDVVNAKRGGPYYDKALAFLDIAVSDFMGNVSRPAGSVDTGFVRTAMKAFRSDVPIFDAITRDVWNAADLNTMQQIGYELGEDIKAAKDRLVADGSEESLYTLERRALAGKYFDDATNGHVNNPWTGGGTNGTSSRMTRDVR